jgi:hypothetical protein
MKMPLYTFLFKSEKKQKICLGCLDENKKWVRPIKPGGFLGNDITMDNDKIVDIFDVVEMEFGAPIPIKHHTENRSFLPNTKIHFIKKLGEEERLALLKDVSDQQLLQNVQTKYALYDEIIKTGKSTTLIGPLDSFDIQYGNHPKIWFIGKNDQRFSITCTDLKFSTFIKGKSGIFGETSINSKKIDELNGKQTFFVIGLTGDHVKDNGEIGCGKHTYPDSQIEPRYWPMVVSVLTVPDYL